MKTLIYKTIILSAMLCFCNTSFASEADESVTIDSRIKTFIYSENEIFPVVLHYGYQTAIEFGKDETIQTYSVGNQFVWQFSAVGRTLFIRPLEENIVTNMTVITNKRRYYFELYSKMVSTVNDEEMSYVVRFFYPDSERVKVKSAIQEKTSEEIPTIKPYNFQYEIRGSNKNVISVVFDNGINTFFKFTKQPQTIQMSCDGKNVSHKTLGQYVLINKICSKSDVNLNGQIITVNAIK